MEMRATRTGESQPLGGDAVLVPSPRCPVLGRGGNAGDEEAEAAEVQRAEPARPQVPVPDQAATHLEPHVALLRGVPHPV